MTVPYCEVVGWDPIPTRHTLATRSGVHALVNMIAADQYWRPVSKPGKDALRAAYLAALATAQPGDRIPLPALPDDVHPATARSLERRGLVATVDGESKVRLTALGVSVCAWSLLGEKRPIETATPRQEVL